MAKQDKSALSPKQRQAAEMLANPDFTGTVTELCKTIDISRTTFYRWMDRQAFRGYLNELIDKFTASELSGVWKALVRKCCGGDTQAIRLFFELKRYAYTAEGWDRGRRKEGGAWQNRTNRP